MGFIRRKSVATADGEEVRTRRRLSKPMTSKSSGSPGGSTSTKSRSGSVSMTSSQMSLTDIARTMSKDDSRVKAKSQIFEVVEEVKPTPVPKSVPRRKAVASLVMQFENAAAAASQTSLNTPVSPVKPTTTAYNHRLNGIQEPQCLSNRGSQDLLKLHKQSLSNMASPADSLELLADPFAIPRRRESKYRPGDATRKASAEDKEKTLTTMEQKFGEDGNLSPSNALGTKSESSRDSTPPVPAIRTASPSNIDFQSIGGLRLGSLHIVNGRSSPVVSDFSKHLISNQLRDVSSIYAESARSEDKASEDWEDDEVATEADEDEDVELDEPSTPTRLHFTNDAATAPIHAEAQYSSDLRTTPKTPVTPDRTSIMAQAYMNELRGSPFCYGTVSPLSTGSVVHHSDLPEMDQVSNLTSDVEEPSRSLSVKSEQPSMDSRPSMPETVKTRDQVFSSALEFQAPHFEPPRSPERGLSPISQRPDSVGENYGKADSGYNSGASLFSFQIEGAKIGDNRTRSQLNISQTAAAQSPEQGDRKKASSKRESSPWRLGRFFPRRPASQNPPVSNTAVPSLATVRTEPTVALPAMITPVKSHEPVEKATMSEPRKSSRKAEKEIEDKKAQKRLQKLRPRSRARESSEIVVQRLASCESTLDIPSIPDNTKVNLYRRSMQLPELERTFNNQGHMRNQASVSNLDLLSTKIRFPSPTPEPDIDERRSRDYRKERDRSSSRTRSRSRRLSFLDMFKSDKRLARRQDEASREDTNFVIADVGDMVASLGANPYAITHSRPPSPSPSPSPVVRRKPMPPTSYPTSSMEDKQRRRLSMSDEQASEFARARSHSFNGREYKGDKKQYSNEQGLVLGKYLKTSTTGDDVPPIPPLPGKDELRRISQRLSMQSQYLGTPAGVRTMWEQTPSPDQQVANRPILPLPDRSPRQSFDDHNYADEYMVEDDFEHAPPPPSHSPAPMDLTPPSISPSPLPMDIQPESPWDRQARIWRQKRRSANEALETHRSSLDIRPEYTYAEVSTAEDDNELAYPVIPPRHPGRPKSSHHSSPARWNHDDGQHADVGQDYQVQRSRTWDDGAQIPYDGQEHFTMSHSSFQSGQHRHDTWSEDHDGNAYNDPSYVARQAYYERPQSGQRPRVNLDDHQTFFNPRSAVRDRARGHPTGSSVGSHDSYGHQEQFYTPQPSPARGRGRVRDAHGYNDYDNQNYGHNGYDNRLYGHQPDAHGVRNYPHEVYSDNLPQLPPQRPLSQQRPYYQPTPEQSQPARFSPAVPYPRSHATPSPARSRPTSRHSRYSTNADVGLIPDLAQSFDQPPPIAPLEFGRYSGGFGFGYEGRNAGFGGSAGTRNGCGKAEGQWKSVAARQQYGVDLADVPVIGVVKRVAVGSR